MDQQLKFDILTNTVGGEKVDQLKSKFSELEHGAEGLSSKLVKFASFEYLFERGIEAVGEFVHSFTEVIETADKLAVLSEKTGIAAVTLSQFNEAAKQSGVEVDQMDKGIKKFNQNLGDPNNKAFADGMKSLGIATKDSTGALKESDVLLKEVSDRFENMKDGPGKAALAVQLFGKSGSDLIPVLNLGSKEIETFGLRMGREFPEDAKRFNDAVESSKKILVEQKIAILQDVVPALTQVIVAWNKVQDSQKLSGFGDSTKFIKDIALDLYTAFKITADALDNIFLQINKSAIGLKTIFKGIIQEITNPFGSDKWEKVIGQGDAQLKKLSEEFKARAQQRENDIYVFDKGLGGGAEPAKAKAKAIAPSVVDESLVKEMDQVKKFKIAQQEQIDVQKLQIENYQLSKAELDKLTFSQKLMSQAEKESVTFKKEESKAALMEITKEIIKQKEALIDAEEQNKKTWSVGAKQALTEYLERIRNVAAQTKSLFANAFQSMEDSLVNFVKTGKLNFQNFANAVIDQLIRIAVQQATLGVLTTIGVGIAGGASAAPSGGAASGGTGYLGANTSFNANGGIVSSAGVMPLSRFASGGVVNQPHVAMFGEAGPEAFVPLPDGRAIPVSMKGGGGGSFNITINVVDGSTSENSSGSKDAAALGRAISAAVKAELVTQKRPGGLLA